MLGLAGSALAVSGHLVYYKLRNGKGYVPVDVAPGDTVGHLIDQIPDAHSVWRISYGGAVLGAETTLADAGIGAEAFVDVEYVPKLVGQMVNVLPTKEGHQHGIILRFKIIVDKEPRCEATVIVPTQTEPVTIGTDFAKEDFEAALAYFQGNNKYNTVVNDGTLPATILQRSIYIVNAESK